MLLSQVLKRELQITEQLKDQPTHCNHFEEGADMGMEQPPLCEKCFDEFRT